MSAQNLAAHLSLNNIKTEYDEVYSGGRGTYTFISSVYKWVDSTYGADEAHWVAEAFVDSSGGHAWE
ncbi:hypothetical protein ES705_39047 [subsurface metagenome]